MCISRPWWAAYLVYPPRLFQYCATTIESANYFVSAWSEMCRHKHTNQCVAMGQCLCASTVVVFVWSECCRIVVPFVARVSIPECPQNCSTQISISLQTTVKLKRVIIGMTARSSTEYARYTCTLHILETYAQRIVLPLGRCRESVELYGYGLFGITWWLGRRAKYRNLRTRS